MNFGQNSRWIVQHSASNTNTVDVTINGDLVKNRVNDMNIVVDDDVVLVGDNVVVDDVVVNDVVDDDVVDVAVIVFYRKLDAVVIDTIGVFVVEKVL